MSDIYPGYLRLTAKAGPCGEIRPCWYTVDRFSDGVLDISFAVEAGDDRLDWSSSWEIKHRHKPSAYDPHGLGLFREDWRFLTMVLPRHTASGPGGTFSILWEHEVPNDLLCTAGFPGAREIIK